MTGFLIVLALASIIFFTFLMFALVFYLRGQWSSPDTDSSPTPSRSSRRSPNSRTQR